MKNNKREMLLTSLVCLLPLFAGAALYPRFAGDHGDTLGLFRQRKRLVVACRHCVRPAAVYFGTASRLLLRREP